MFSQRLLSVVPDGYRCMRELPHGTLGPTLLLKQRVTDRYCVMKLCEKSLFGTPEAVENFKQAIERLNLISNDHILGVISMWETEEFIVIVRSYVETDDLARYISTRKALVTNHMVAMWKAVCEQMIVLQNHNIGPFLIRTNNVFVDLDGSVKLVDMYPVPCDLGERVCMGRQFGRDLLPLELLRGELLTEKTNAWGMAVLLVTMVAGEPPGPHGNLQRLFHQLQEHQLQFSPQTPSEIREIAEKVLVSDPGLRPDLEGLLKYVNEVERFSTPVACPPSTARKTGMNVLRRTSPNPLKAFGMNRMMFTMTRNSMGGGSDYETYFNTT